MRGILSKQLIVLTLFAFAVYAVGVWWGMPAATAPERVQSWGVDDESPLGPLTEIHNIIEPKPNQWLSYPLLYSFVTAAAYTPYMGYLFVTGGIEGLGAVYPFGLVDIETNLKVLTLIAHLVSVVMGALTVAAAYDIGHSLTNKRTAVFYALLVLFSFPLVYYARNGNVDAMAMAFVALATAAVARIAKNGFTPAHAIWFGLFAGLALAAKESSVGVFLGVPFFLLYWHFRVGENRASVESIRQFSKPAGLGLLAAFLAFGLGSGLFVDPGRYFAHVAYLRDLLALVASSDTPSANTFGYDLAGNIGYLTAMLRNLAAAISLPGVVVSAAGIVIALRHRPRLLLLAGLAFVYFLYLFVSYRLAQVRYLMPVTFLLLFYVAYATFNGRSRLTRSAGLALGLLTLASSVLNTVDITYQMLFDSRYAAAAWLAPRTEPGATIAYFGPVSKLPHLEEGVLTEQATEYAGMYVAPRVDDNKVNEILSKWAGKPPTFIVIMPDHTNPHPIPYSHTVPPQLYQGLIDGTLGYTEVGYFQTQPLFPWLPAPRLDYPTVNPPIRIFAPLR